MARRGEAAPRPTSAMKSPEIDSNGFRYHCLDLAERSQQRLILFLANGS
jgi:hypothetical protein